MTTVKKRRKSQGFLFFRLIFQDGRHLDSLRCFHVHIMNSNTNRVILFLLLGAYIEMYKAKYILFATLHWKAGILNDRWHSL